MGLINPTHVVLIAIAAVIVLGPRRLPELIRAGRRALDELRAGLTERDRNG